MKTVGELLRTADPLGNEPARDGRDRRVRRQRVMDFEPAPGAVRPAAARRVAIAAGAALVIGAGVAMYVSRASVDVVAAVRFEVRLAEDSPASGLREVSVQGGRTIYLHEETVAANSDIARAQVIPGQTAGTFWVAVTFTEAGATKMARASEDHIGRPLAILIDGEVVMAPTVRSAITTEATISGDFTQAEAQRIVDGVIGR